MPKSSPGDYGTSIGKFYDPDFTAKISSKMQVPDKISLRSTNDTRSFVELPQGEQKGFMHVPERILVAGGNNYIGAREPPPEFQLESSFVAEPPKTILPNPPHVISLSSYSGLDPLSRGDSTALVQNGGNELSELNDSAMNVYHNPEEEIIMLRKQMKLLNHRVSSLEQENQIRQQREILLYSVGVVYFVLKGLLWLNRHI